MMKKQFKTLSIILSVIFVVMVIGAFSANKYYESRLEPEINIEEAKDVTELKQILDKHKGSLLYVDHSSVNCGACFVELKNYVPQLQARYKNKPITFVYICSESNYPLKTVSNSVLWRRKLAAAKAKGHHYLVNNEFSMKLFDQTVSKNEMPYYPWQFIVDENGKIINRHAIRPSNLPQLYQQLDSLLLTRQKKMI
ncbi:hypothetical protein [Emticicia sp. 21SJ11W-3]|uniref:TlpA family protein disulfide reductase n=1 Tax=Emticicia sp. 21SJ11W-3 TaxID=2916755 RepID=UPI00209F91BD|nr:hypothetical protein [Emticicia sp. 21SJ11W-3]UTA69603.1 hypothetical protein MB380_07275 [Emticicia sp. 21SJ11W-3]